MDWKTLLACITGSVEEQLLLRNEYVIEENRIFRNQIAGRMQLTDAERQTLAEIGKKLGKRHWFRVMSCAHEQYIWTLRL
jgi:hypothetical protein